MSDELPEVANDLTMGQVAYLFDNHSKAIILLMKGMESLLARVQALEKSFGVIIDALIEEDAEEAHKPGGYL